MKPGDRIITNNGDVFIAKHVGPIQVTDGERNFNTLECRLCTEEEWNQNTIDILECFLSNFEECEDIYDAALTMLIENQIEHIQSNSIDLDQELSDKQKLLEIRKIELEIVEHDKKIVEAINLSRPNIIAESVPLSKREVKKMMKHWGKQYK